MNKFSFDTIDDFDSHIDLSIPNYSGLIEHILSISSYFIKDSSLVYDLGCSTGKLINELCGIYPYTKFVGVDKSVNLAKDNIHIVKGDLETFKLLKNDFTTSIFTLQFLSLELRKMLLKRVYESLNQGGAFLVAEKIFIDDGFTQDLFTFSYYDFKLKSFTISEIISKQIDLRTMMRPLTEEQNIELFKEAGFKNAYSFWQSLQFKAWVLIK